MKKDKSLSIDEALRLYGDPKEVITYSGHLSPKQLEALKELWKKRGSHPIQDGEIFFLPPSPRFWQHWVVIAFLVLSLILCVAAMVEVFLH